MRRLHLAAVIAMCAALLATAGCFTRRVEKETVIKEPAPAAAPTEIIIQSETMPPPRVEEPSSPPSTEYVWVAGYWEKTSRGWLWHPGHWERR